MVALEDICYSISDGDHNAPPKTTDINSVPFVTISNMQPEFGCFDFSSANRVPIDYYDSLADIRKPKKGDIVYSVVGSFGIPILVKTDDPFVFQRHIAVLRPNNNLVLSEYLYYLMGSRAFYSWADAAAIGAAQRTITLGSLRQKQIALPSLEEQGQIVATLRPYDALIENNRKQIKLLEEATHRLYKEWFIDLRFPGYETASTNLKTGLPEGWKKIPLGSYQKFKRGTIVTEKNTNPGSIPVVAGGRRPAYYHDIANTKGPVVTISGSGANAGFTRLYMLDIWASDCSYVDSSMCQTIFFVYETVLVLGNGFKHLQRGSAQPHVYPKDINELPIILPDETVLSNFEKHASTLYREISLLEREINTASEARDRLLPMLLSDEAEA